MHFFFLKILQLFRIFKYIILDNRPLPINRKQKVFPNGTLIIENVERNSDQATYTCVAKNVEGYSARGSLDVQVMGKFFLLPKHGIILLLDKYNPFHLKYETII